jgi:hypothetical protein
MQAKVASSLSRVPDYAVAAVVIVALLASAGLFFGVLGS